MSGYVPASSFARAVQSYPAPDDHYDGGEILDAGSVIFEVN